MKKFQQTFTVTGRLSFPIDMLRYDQCWPYSQEDASKIHAFTDGSMGRLAETSITLCRWTEARNGKPTADRWSSFGWKIDMKSIRTY